MLDCGVCCNFFILFYPLLFEKKNKTLKILKKICTSKLITFAEVENMHILCSIFFWSKLLCNTVSRLYTHTASECPFGHHTDSINYN